jgi:hypothetical protein
MDKMAELFFLGCGGILHRALIFMIKFGWRSRYRLPILIVVGIVAVDVRMQLDIDLDF